MPIDHIEMYAVSASLIRFHDFVAKARVIGGENRGNDLDGTGHSRPIALTRLRHNAEVQLSPMKAALTAKALAEPVSLCQKTAPEGVSLYGRS